MSCKVDSSSRFAGRGSTRNVNDLVQQIGTLMERPQVHWSAVRVRRCFRASSTGQHLPTERCAPGARLTGRWEDSAREHRYPHHLGAGCGHNKPMGGRPARQVGPRARIKQKLRALNLPCLSPLEAAHSCPPFVVVSGGRRRIRLPAPGTPGKPGVDRREQCHPP